MSKIIVSFLLVTGLCAIYTNTQLWDFPTLVLDISGDGNWAISRVLDVRTNQTQCMVLSYNPDTGTFENHAPLLTVEPITDPLTDVSSALSQDASTIVLLNYVYQNISVFLYNTTTTVWDLSQEITLEVPYDECTLSADSSWLFCSSIGKTYIYYGYVSVFQRNSTGFYNHFQELRYPHPDSFAGFGSPLEISVDNSALIIGAVHQGTSGTVVIYNLNDQNTEWESVQELTLPPQYWDLFFGESIAIGFSDASLIAIGDTGTFEGDEGSIELYFKAPGSDTWEPAGKIANPEPYIGSDFGSVICLSLDGKTLLSSATIGDSGYWTENCLSFLLNIILPRISLLLF
jgi:hypothetical protein